MVKYSSINIMVKFSNNVVELYEEKHYTMFNTALCFSSYSSEFNAIYIIYLYYTSDSRLYTYSIVSFFLLCHKIPSPLFLYIAHKKPSFNDKVWTIDFLSQAFSELSTATSANVQLLGIAKNCPAHKLCYAPPLKIPFINAVKPFYRC